MLFGPCFSRGSNQIVNEHGDGFGLECRELEVNASFFCFRRVLLELFLEFHQLSQYLFNSIIQWVSQLTLHFKFDLIVLDSDPICSVAKQFNLAIKCFGYILWP